ncbi:hypothetical protein EVAR_93232_1 [Eumeta japonica]|uniref:Uncharacterized protein n=1 Tax=Eumeta variegata TaxID=151549 RepID=A0A4C1TY69_EUMVA|nr:hypothetical protein EVAR_93232_1 [Eumeta japonica]
MLLASIFHESRKKSIHYIFLLLCSFTIFDSTRVANLIFLEGSIDFLRRAVGFVVTSLCTAKASDDRHSLGGGNISVCFRVLLQAPVGCCAICIKPLCASRE